MIYMAKICDSPRLSSTFKSSYKIGSQTYTLVYPLSTTIVEMSALQHLSCVWGGRTIKDI